MDIMNDASDKEFEKTLMSVAGLEKFTEKYIRSGKELVPFMELVLFGLSEKEIIGKNILENSLNFSDPLTNLLNDLDD